MNLKDEIRKLVQLQEIDSQIHTLEEEKDVRKPARLKEIRENFQKKKESLLVFEESFKQLQLKKKDREVELASKEENLRKAQGQLYQLKTNKEYQAKLTEIGSLKADISVVEDEVIKILDEIDSVKSKCEFQKKLLAEEEKKFKDEEAELINAIKNLEINIESLRNKRKTFIKSIDKTILVKYERLLKTRQALAIVSVSNNNCSACHMAVTHQKINEIKMYKDLVFCESCVRILYISEDIF